MRYELTDHEWTAIKPMLPNTGASFDDWVVAAIRLAAVMGGMALYRTSVPKMDQADAHRTRIVGETRWQIPASDLLTRAGIDCVPSTELTMPHRPTRRLERQAKAASAT